MLLTLLKTDKEDKKKEIMRTWLTGQHSCTMIIPRDFAKEYGLDEPSHVIIKGRPDGILIKKIEI